jgi:hypothetical protein
MKPKKRKNNLKNVNKKKFPLEKHSFELKKIIFDKK